MFDNEYTDEKALLIELYKELSEGYDKLCDDVFSQIAKLDNESIIEILKTLSSASENNP